MCTRVGVTRMRARISSKCKHTDADSRIGACEVQVAYKDVNGVIQTDVLYSKLHSRRWPLRIVMEKRFQSFILQNKVAVYPPSTNPHGLQIGLVQSYPTDFIKWEDTLQSDPDWTFSSGRDPLAVDLNCNFEKVLCAEETLLNVQWVYDARLFSHIFDASIPTLKSSPPFPGATDILKPSRPQTASSLRSCPVNRASTALAKLNAKSPLNSPRNLISMAEKRSPHIDPKVDDSRSSNVRSYAHVLQKLRDITSQRIRSGGDLEHIIPYHVGVLVKRGVIVAETVSCCALLRQSLITASFSTNTQSGPSVTPERVQANFLSLFESLDYKGLGFLNVTDIDTLLTLIQSRRSSDQALRLVILSLGESYESSFCSPYHQYYSTAEFTPSLHLLITLCVN